MPLSLLARRVFLASLFVATAASAQTTYRDPSGNFSVEVPAGWHSEKNPQSSEVTISKGNVTVSFDVAASQDGSTPSPKAVLDDIEQQLMKECPQAEIIRRGDANLAGLPGLFLQVSCQDSKRGTAIMTVEVATSNGQILVCNASSFSSEYASAKPVVEGIIKSFRLGVAGAAKMRGDDANQSSGAGNSSVIYRKLQALESACQAAVFTPEECAAKRAAIKSGGPTGGQTSQQPPPSSGWTGDGMPPSETPSNSPSDSNAGTVYANPNGAFKLVIPQGWTAKPQIGCYGPKENCPSNSGGVNITQGNSWAFVAPFSADARKPTDIVEVVAEQYQSQYKNLKMIQNEPQKFGNLDIALGQFTATDGRGVTVSLVVIGIVAPNRNFYVACSSVDPNDAPTAGPALNSMLQSLQFAGQ